VRIALHTRVRADAWQARMAELLDVAHDYSASGADTALPVVWEL
jgi:L-rhamnose mutarotase